jgi:large subunit ribosomal protein L4
MKVDIKNLNNEVVGNIELNDSIFALPARPDILARVVRWQLAKRQQGTHATKTIAQISGTTKKPFRQKGTGNARQGSLRSPQFRGGAVIFGPVPRSHAHDLPKKVRVLGLKTALSAKAAQGKLIVIDDLVIDSHKTKDVIQNVHVFGKSLLFIDGVEINENFSKALSNIPLIDLLPQQGANVYDILRRDILVLSKSAIKSLEERLA